MNSELRRIYAIQKANEERFLKLDSTIPHASGIYILHRYDENGFKYAYVGQAKDLLKRLGQHLSGHSQHIDRSLKKHNLKNIENPHGYQVRYYLCSESQLDEEERKYIKLCADNGYQLRNVTLGGQNIGKTNINENKPAKSYRDGVEYGKLKMQRTMREYFEKYLDARVKKDNKICNKKLNEFYETLKEEKDEDKQS